MSENPIPFCFVAMICLSHPILWPVCYVVYFSARFMIYNSTFGADIFQVFLHWWGTASSSYSMCCSLATPLLNITKSFKFLYSKVAYAHYGKHVPWPSLAVSFQSRRVASITLKSGIQKCGRTLERIVPYMYCFGS